MLSHGSKQAMEWLDGVSGVPPDFHTLAPLVNITNNKYSISMLNQSKTTDLPITGLVVISAALLVLSLAIQVTTNFKVGWP